MTKAKQSGAFKGHRFPSISYAVWAYFRFPMSFRDVEDLLHKRGVIVSYEPGFPKWPRDLGLSALLFVVHFSMLTGARGWIHGTPCRCGF